MLHGAALEAQDGQRMRFMGGNENIIPITNISKRSYRIHLIPRITFSSLLSPLMTRPNMYICSLVLEVSIQWNNGHGWGWRCVGDQVKPGLGKEGVPLWRRRETRLNGWISSEGSGHREPRVWDFPLLTKEHVSRPQFQGWWQKTWHSWVRDKGPYHSPHSEQDGHQQNAIKHPCPANPTAMMQRGPCGSCAWSEFASQLRIHALGRLESFLTCS